VLSSTLTTTFPELERLAAEYFAALLTEEELRALIGFWSTPHGLSITRKERSGERPNGEEMRAFNAFFDTPIGNVIAEKARTMKIEDVFRAYIGLWTDAAERELCARATCRGGSVSAT